MNLHAYLPKWPEHRVVGEPVTTDQAGEIILRSMGWTEFFSNDRQFVAEARRVLELPEDPFGGKDSWRATQAWRERFHALELDYLSVGGRIASSYIGGPQGVGWIGWGGTIGTEGHNIGKWPRVENVLTEWSALAEAFPFLDLTSQLFDGEAGFHEHARPIVEFRVKDGACTQVEPGEGLRFTARPRRSFEDEIVDVVFQAKFGLMGRERGVNLDHLADQYAKLCQKFPILLGEEVPDGE